MNVEVKMLYSTKGHKSGEVIRAVLKVLKFEYFILRRAFIRANLCYFLSKCLVLVFLIYMKCNFEMVILGPMLPSKSYRQ